MTKFRESLVNRMIQIYGTQHKFITEFRRLCETWEDNDWNNKCLAILVHTHETEPVNTINELKNYVED